MLARPLSRQPARAPTTSPEPPVQQVESPPPAGLDATRDAGAVVGEVQDLLGNQWMLGALGSAGGDPLSSAVIGEVGLGLASVAVAGLASGANQAVLAKMAGDLDPEDLGPSPSVDRWRARLAADGLRVGPMPLPAAVRARMEAAFGHDFSAVRLHVGPTAAAGADAIQAAAYAVGPDVVFGGGRFSPDTPAGMALLAHELAHVVQHDEGRAPRSRSGGFEVSSPSDAVEREADRMASAALGSLGAGAWKAREPPRPAEHPPDLAPEDAELSPGGEELGPEGEELGPEGEGETAGPVVDDPFEAPASSDDVADTGQVPSLNAEDGGTEQAEDGSPDRAEATGGAGGDLGMDAATAGAGADPAMDAAAAKAERRREARREYDRRRRAAQREQREAARAQDPGAATGAPGPRGTRGGRGGRGASRQAPRGTTTDPSSPGLEAAPTDLGVAPPSPEGEEIGQERPVEAADSRSEVWADGLGELAEAAAGELRQEAASASSEEGEGSGGGEGGPILRRPRAGPPSTSTERRAPQAEDRPTPAAPRRSPQSSGDGFELGEAARLLSRGLPRDTDPSERMIQELRDRMGVSLAEMERLLGKPDRPGPTDSGADAETAHRREALQRVAARRASDVVRMAQDRLDVDAPDRREWARPGANDRPPPTMDSPTPPSAGSRKEPPTPRPVPQHPEPPPGVGEQGGALDKGPILDPNKPLPRTDPATEQAHVERMLRGLTGMVDRAVQDSLVRAMMKKGDRSGAQNPWADHTLPAPPKENRAPASPRENKEPASPKENKAPASPKENKAPAPPGGKAPAQGDGRQPAPGDRKQPAPSPDGKPPADGKQPGADQNKDKSNKDKSNKDKSNKDKANKDNKGGSDSQDEERKQQLDADSNRIQSDLAQVGQRKSTDERLLREAKERLSSMKAELRRRQFAARARAAGGGGHKKGRKQRSGAAGPDTRMAGLQQAITLQQRRIPDLERVATGSRKDYEGLQNQLLDRQSQAEQADQKAQEAKKKAGGGGGGGAPPVDHYATAQKVKEELEKKVYGELQKKDAKLAEEWKAKVAEHKKVIGDLAEKKGQVVKAQEDKAKAEAEVKRLQAAINARQGAIKAEKGKPETDGQLATLKAQLATAQGNVTTQTGRLQTLDGEMKDLEAKRNQLADEVNKLQSQVLDSQSGLGKAASVLTQLSDQTSSDLLYKYAAEQAGIKVQPVMLPPGKERDPNTLQLVKKGEAKKAIGSPQPAPGTNDKDAQIARIITTVPREKQEEEFNKLGIKPEEARQRYKTRMEGIDKKLRDKLGEAGDKGYDESKVKGALSESEYLAWKQAQERKAQEKKAQELYGGDDPSAAWEAMEATRRKKGLKDFAAVEKYLENTNSDDPSIKGARDRARANRERREQQEQAPRDKDLKDSQSALDKLNAEIGKGTPTAEQKKRRDELTAQIKDLQGKQRDVDKKRSDAQADAKRVDDETRDAEAVARARKVDVDVARAMITGTISQSGKSRGDVVTALSRPSDPSRAGKTSDPNEIARVQADLKKSREAKKVGDQADLSKIDPDALAGAVLAGERTDSSGTLKGGVGNEALEAYLRSTENLTGEAKIQALLQASRMTGKTIAELEQSNANWNKKKTIAASYNRIHDQALDPAEKERRWKKFCEDNHIDPDRARGLAQGMNQDIKTRVDAANARAGGAPVLAKDLGEKPIKGGDKLRQATDALVERTGMPRELIEMHVQHQDWKAREADWTKRFGGPGARSEDVLPRLYRRCREYGFKDPDELASHLGDLPRDAKLPPELAAWKKNVDRDKKVAPEDISKDKTKTAAAEVKIAKVKAEMDARWTSRADLTKYFTDLSPEERLYLRTEHPDLYRSVCDYMKGEKGKTADAFNKARDETEGLERDRQEAKIEAEDPARKAREQAALDREARQRRLEATTARLNQNLKKGETALEVWDVRDHVGALGAAWGVDEAEVQRRLAASGDPRKALKDAYRGKGEGQAMNPALAWQMRRIAGLPPEEREDAMASLGQSTGLSQRTLTAAQKRSEKEDKLVQSIHGLRNAPPEERDRLMKGLLGKEAKGWKREDLEALYKRSLTRTEAAIPKDEDLTSGSIYDLDARAAELARKYNQPIEDVKRLIQARRDEKFEREQRGKIDATVPGGWAAVQRRAWLQGVPPEGLADDVARRRDADWERGPDGQVKDKEGYALWQALRSSAGGAKKYEVQSTEAEKEEQKSRGLRCDPKSPEYLRKSLALQDMLKGHGDPKKIREAFDKMSPAERMQFARDLRAAQAEGEIDDDADLHDMFHGADKDAWAAFTRQLRKADGDVARGRDLVEEDRNFDPKDPGYVAKRDRMYAVLNEGSNASPYFARGVWDTMSPAEKAAFQKEYALYQNQLRARVTAGKEDEGKLPPQLSVILKDRAVDLADADRAGRDASVRDRMRADANRRQNAWVVASEALAQDPGNRAWQGDMRLAYRKILLLSEDMGCSPRNALNFLQNRPYDPKLEPETGVPAHIEAMLGDVQRRVNPKFQVRGKDVAKTDLVGGHERRADQVESARKALSAEAMKGAKKADVANLVTALNPRELAELMRDDPELRARLEAMDLGDRKGGVRLALQKAEFFEESRALQETIAEGRKLDERRNLPVNAPGGLSARMAWIRSLPPEERAAEWDRLSKEARERKMDSADLLSTWLNNGAAPGKKDAKNPGMLSPPMLRLVQSMESLPTQTARDEALALVARSTGRWSPRVQGEPEATTDRAAVKGLRAARERSEQEKDTAARVLEIQQRPAGEQYTLLAQLAAERGKTVDDLLKIRDDALKAGLVTRPAAGVDADTRKRLGEIQRLDPGDRGAALLALSRSSGVPVSELVGQLQRELDEVRKRQGAAISVSQKADALEQILNEGYVFKGDRDKIREAIKAYEGRPEELKAVLEELKRRGNTKLDDGIALRWKMGSLTKSSDDYFDTKRILDEARNYEAPPDLPRGVTGADVDELNRRLREVRRGGTGEGSPERAAAEKAIFEQMRRDLNLDEGSFEAVKTRARIENDRFQRRVDWMREAIVSSNRGRGWVADDRMKAVLKDASPAMMAELFRDGALKEKVLGGVDADLKSDLSRRIELGTRLEGKDARTWDKEIKADRLAYKKEQLAGAIGPPGKLGGESGYLRAAELLSDCTDEELKALDEHYQGALQQRLLRAKDRAEQWTTGKVLQVIGTAIYTGNLLIAGYTAYKMSGDCDNAESLQVRGRLKGLTSNKDVGSKADPTDKASVARIDAAYQSLQAELKKDFWLDEKKVLRAMVDLSPAEILALEQKFKGDDNKGPSLKDLFRQKELSKAVGALADAEDRVSGIDRNREMQESCRGLAIQDRIRELRRDPANKARSDNELYDLAISDKARIESATQERIKRLQTAASEMHAAMEGAYTSTDRLLKAVSTVRPEEQDLLRLEYRRHFSQDLDTHLEERKNGLQDRHLETARMMLSKEQRDEGLRRYILTMSGSDATSVFFDPKNLLAGPFAVFVAAARAGYAYGSGPGGIGEDEDGIYAAFQNMSPEERTRVAHGPGGEAFMRAVKLRLGTQEAGIVDAITEVDPKTGLAEGDPAHVAAAKMRLKLEGTGDWDQIWSCWSIRKEGHMEILKDLTPDQLREAQAWYAQRYGSNMAADLKGDLGENSRVWQVAEAEMRGDKVGADAQRLRWAAQDENHWTKIAIAAGALALAPLLGPAVIVLAIAAATGAINLGADRKMMDDALSGGKEGRGGRGPDHHLKVIEHFNQQFGATDDVYATNNVLRGKGGTAFQRLLDDKTSGVARAYFQEVAQEGEASPELTLLYAFAGVGTDEKKAKAALQRVYALQGDDRKAFEERFRVLAAMLVKDPMELLPGPLRGPAAALLWVASPIAGLVLDCYRNPGQLKDWIESEFSGTELLEVQIQARGKPSQPSDYLELAKLRYAYERAGPLNEVMNAFMEGLQALGLTNAASQLNLDTMRVFELFDDQGRPRNAECERRIEEIAAWQEGSATHYREVRDSWTDAVTNTMQVVGGALIAVIPGLEGVGAMIIANVILQASIIAVKFAMKGHGYGVEALMGDLAELGVTIASLGMAHGLSGVGERMAASVAAKVARLEKATPWLGRLLAPLRSEGGMELVKLLTVDILKGGAEGFLRAGLRGEAALDEGSFDLTKHLFLGALTGALQGAGGALATGAFKSMPLGKRLALLEKMETPLNKVQLVQKLGLGWMQNMAHGAATTLLDKDRWEEWAQGKGIDLKLFQHLFVNTAINATSTLKSRPGGNKATAHTAGDEAPPLDGAKVWARIKAIPPEERMAAIRALPPQHADELMHQMSSGQVRPNAGMSSHDWLLARTGMETPGVVGFDALKRAPAALERYSEADQKRVKSLLDQSRSPEEHGIILKAVAAGNPVSDLEALASYARGRPASQLVDHLNLGDPRGVGGGLRQQTDTGCGAIVMLAYRAQHDPVFALKLRAAHPWLDGVDWDNPGPHAARLAALEREIEAGGRSSDQAGTGRWMHEDFRNISREVGIDLRRRQDPTGEEAAATMRLHTAAGRVMPIVLQGVHDPSVLHYVLVQDVRVHPDGSHAFLILDPEGRAPRWIPAGQVASGKIGIDGMHFRVKEMEVPEHSTAPAPRSAPMGFEETARRAIDLQRRAQGEEAPAGFRDKEPRPFKPNGEDHPSKLGMDEFVQAYKTAGNKASTTLSDDDLRQAWRVGMVINPKTGLLNDPEAGDHGPPDLVARYKIGPHQEIDLQKHMGAQDSADFKQLAQLRDRALTLAANRERAGDKEGADVARAWARQYSEDLGNRAADTWAKSKGLEHVYTGSGSGTFDKVYQDPKTGRLVVVEAKGGTSDLGDRYAAHADGSVNKDSRVQQGTKEYAGAVLSDMRRKAAGMEAGPERQKLEGLVNRLEQQLAEGSLRYHVVKQPVVDSQPGAAHVAEFDVTQGGLANKNGKLAAFPAAPRGLGGAKPAEEDPAAPPKISLRTREDYEAAVAKHGVPVASVDDPSATPPVRRPLAGDRELLGLLDLPNRVRPVRKEGEAATPEQAEALQAHIASWVRLREEQGLTPQERMLLRELAFDLLPSVGPNGATRFPLELRFEDAHIGGGSPTTGHAPDQVEQAWQKQRAEKLESIAFKRKRAEDLASSNPDRSKLLASQADQMEADLAKVTPAYKPVWASLRFDKGDAALGPGAVGGMDTLMHELHHVVDERARVRGVSFGPDSVQRYHAELRANLATTGFDADRALRLTLAANPGFASVLDTFGLHGQPADAVARAVRALARLDEAPRDARRLLAERPDEARAAVQTALQPTSSPEARAEAPAPRGLSPRRGPPPQGAPADEEAPRSEAAPLPPAAARRAANGLDVILGEGTEPIYSFNKDGTPNKRIAEYGGTYGFEGRIDPKTGDYVVRKKLLLVSAGASPALMEQTRQDLLFGSEALFNAPGHEVTVDGARRRLRVELEFVSQRQDDPTAHRIFVHDDTGRLDTDNLYTKGQEGSPRTPEARALGYAHELGHVIFGLGDNYVDRDGQHGPRDRRQTGRALARADQDAPWVTDDRNAMGSHDLPPTLREHVVREGETWQSLAEAHRIPLENLFPRLRFDERTGILKTWIKNEAGEMDGGLMLQMLNPLHGVPEAERRGPVSLDPQQARRFAALQKEVDEAHTLPEGLSVFETWDWRKKAEAMRPSAKGALPPLKAGDRVMLPFGDAPMAPASETGLPGATYGQGLAPWQIEQISWAIARARSGRRADYEVGSDSTPDRLAAKGKAEGYGSAELYQNPRMQAEVAELTAAVGELERAMADHAAAHPGPAQRYADPTRRQAVEAVFTEAADPIQRQRGAEHLVEQVFGGDLHAARAAFDQADSPRTREAIDGYRIDGARRLIAAMSAEHPDLNGRLRVDASDPARPTLVVEGRSAFAADFQRRVEARYGADVATICHGMAVLPSDPRVDAPKTRPGLGDRAIDLLGGIAGGLSGTPVDTEGLRLLKDRLTSGLGRLLRPEDQAQPAPRGLSPRPEPPAEQAPPAARSPAPPVAGSAVATAEDLRTYGMAPATLAALQEAGRVLGVVFDVRPTNVVAVDQRAMGYNPKDQAFKQKTAKPADIVLGVPAEAEGLVVHYRPEMPDAETLARLPDRLRADVIKAVQDRREEFEHYDHKMVELAQAGVIQIDGKVIRSGYNGLPFTGDHDLYRIFRADTGEKLPPEQAEQVAAFLRTMGVGICHGAHLDWSPGTPEEAEVKQRIVDRHVGGEPLLRVGADGASVAFHGTPLLGDPRPIRQGGAFHAEIHEMRQELLASTAPWGGASASLGALEAAERLSDPVQSRLALRALSLGDEGHAARVQDALSRAGRGELVGPALTEELRRLQRPVEIGEIRGLIRPDDALLSAARAGVAAGRAATLEPDHERALLDLAVGRVRQGQMSMSGLDLEAARAPAAQSGQHALQRAWLTHALESELGLPAGSVTHHETAEREGMELAPEHGFAVVRFPSGRTWLVDTALGHLLDPGGSGLEAGLRLTRHDPGAALATALQQDGYVQLTDEVARHYGQALSGRPGWTARSLADRTQRPSNAEAPVVGAAGEAALVGARPRGGAEAAMPSPLALLQPAEEAGVRAAVRGGLAPRESALLESRDPDKVGLVLDQPARKSAIEDHFSDATATPDLARRRAGELSQLFDGDLVAALDVFGSGTPKVRAALEAHREEQARALLDRAQFGYPNLALVVTDDPGGGRRALVVHAYGDAEDRRLAARHLRELGGATLARLGLVLREDQAEPPAEDATGPAARVQADPAFVGGRFGPREIETRARVEERIHTALRALALDAAEAALGAGDAAGAGREVDRIAGQMAGKPGQSHLRGLVAMGGDVAGRLRAARALNDYADLLDRDASELSSDDLTAVVRGIYHLHLREIEALRVSADPALGADERAAALARLGPLVHRKYIDEAGVENQLKGTYGPRYINSVGMAENTEGMTAQQVCFALGLDYKGSTNFADDAGGALRAQRSLLYLDNPLHPADLERSKIPVHPRVAAHLGGMADAGDPQAQALRGRVRPTDLYAFGQNGQDRRNFQNPYTGLGATRPGLRAAHAADAEISTLNVEHLVHRAEAIDLRPGATMARLDEHGNRRVFAVYDGSGWRLTDDDDLEPGQRARFHQAAGGAAALA